MKKRYALSAALLLAGALGTLTSAAAENSVRILGNSYNPSMTPMRAPEYKVSDILVDEDFSLMPKASIESPAQIVAMHENGTIADSMTRQPGWWGSGIYGVEGICYLRNDSPYSQATLNTPRGDWSGTISLTIRLKPLQTPYSDGTTPTGSNIRIAPMTYGDALADTDFPKAEGGAMYFRLYEKDGWQEITATYQCYSTDLDGYISFASDTDCLIDDIRITTTADFVGAPTMLQLTDTKDDAFTINWMPVRKAFNYYVHLFTFEGYDNQGNPLFERAYPGMSQEDFDAKKQKHDADTWLTDPYICNYHTTAGDGVTSYTFSGLDPQKEYFYCVQSHLVKDFSSMDRKYHAMYASTPGLLPAQDIDKTEGRYTARWNAVDKADSYKVNNYGVYTLTEDFDDYPLLEEDFSGFEALSDAVGINDMEWPDLDSDHSTVLNDNTELPGWSCDMLGYASGKAGICSPWGGYISTPPLDVKNTDKITLSLGVEVPAEGTQVAIYFAGQKVLLTAEGLLSTGEVEIPTNGCVESPIVFQSADGMSVFLLDYLRVARNVKKGDDITIFQGAQDIPDPTTDACTFTGLDFSDFADYAYQVTATRSFDDPLLRRTDVCESAFGGRQRVLNPTAALNLHPAQHIEADVPAIYYNLQGQRVDAPQHGVYIKVQGSTAVKVML